MFKKNFPQTLILALTFLFSGIHATAQEGGGGSTGGGLGYVCGDEVLTMDYLEGLQRKEGFTYTEPTENALGGGPVTLRKLVYFYLNRLNEKDDRATEYRPLADLLLDWIEKFEAGHQLPINSGGVRLLSANGSAVKFVSGKIPFSHDAKPKFRHSLPRNCNPHPVQIIRLEEDRYFESNQYVFSISYWTKMNLFQKTFLLMHELFYREMRFHFGQLTSDFARSLNEVVMSDQFPNRSVCNWFQDIRKARFPFIYSNVQIIKPKWPGHYNSAEYFYPNSIECYPSGRLKHITSPRYMDDYLYHWPDLHFELQEMFFDEYAKALVHGTGTLYSPYSFGEGLQNFTFEAAEPGSLILKWVKGLWLVKYLGTDKGNENGRYLIFKNAPTDARVSLKVNLIGSSFFEATGFELQTKIQH